MSKVIELSGVADPSGQRELPAGGFSLWLRRIRSAQIKEHGVDVPCGDCNACCRSSYFIHIRPEETQTLRRIPKKLLFPAPFLPKGNVLLGYDERGQCPMLIAGKCAIYEHRPLTCRTYDCRIFTAAGIAADEADKALIAERIRRWQFSYPTERDRNQHLAVQAAARFLRECAGCFPAGAIPGNSTQLAVLALKVYRVFLKNSAPSSETGRLSPDPKLAARVMKAAELFDAKCVKPKEHPPVRFNRS